MQVQNHSALLTRFLSKPIPIPNIEEEVIIEPNPGVTKFRLHVVGDTHLRDKSSRRNNGASITFSNEVSGLTNKVKDKTQDVLSINGDAIGLMESGQRAEPPFGKKGELLDPDFELETLDRIISDNKKPFDKLSKFLAASDNTMIVFGDDNHGRQIFHSDGGLLRALIVLRLFKGREDISTIDLNRVRFCKALVSPEHGTYSKHCHDLDPFNYTSDGQNTAGDWVIVTSNSVVKQIIKDLQGAGLQPIVLEAAIDKVEKALTVRPSITFPLFLEYEAMKLPEIGNGNIDKVSVKKAQEIMLSYNNVVRDSFLRTPIAKTLEKLSLLPPKKILSSKRLQRLGTRIVSTIEGWRSDNNGFHIKELRRLYRELAARGINITHLIGSHTHIADHKELFEDGENLHYVNPGAWPPYKLVIDGQPLGTTHPSGIFQASIDYTKSKPKVRFKHKTEETWTQNIRSSSKFS